MDDHDATRPLPPGTKVREFEIERQLGEGSFGIVYAAKHEILGEIVAIKEFLPRDLARRTEGNHVEALAGKSEAYEWAREKFLREARTLTALAYPRPHPNLVRVIHAFPDNDTVYMCMQYEEGTPLDKFLSQRGSLPEPELREILFPLLDGLAHAHAHSIWHRDIKPSNILIRDDGSPVLIDFGAARQAIGSRDRSVMAQCTPGYAAPEQLWSDEEHGPWTDIYALGATLYRAVTGEPPHGFSRTALREDHKQQYSESFLAAIEAALEPKPEDRPQTVREWRERFQAVVSEPPGADAPTVLRPGAGNLDATRIVVPDSTSAKTTETTQPPQPPVEQQKPERKPRRWLWVSLGVVLIALVGVALWQRVLVPQPMVEAPPSAQLDTLDDRSPHGAPSAVSLEDGPTLQPGVAQPKDMPIVPVSSPGTQPVTDDVEARAADLGPEARSETLAAIERLVSELGCARLDTSLSPDRVLTLRGHLGSRKDLAELRGRLLALEHIERLKNDEVEVYGWPFCQVIATVVDANKGADAGTQKASIVFNKPQPLYREGEYLVVTAMNNNSYDGHLYLDYVDVAGEVVHMLPTPTAPENRVASWGKVVVGAADEQACLQHECYEISPPHGRSLVVATWSREPLLSGPRQEVVEPATDYFTSLASVIRNARASSANELALSYQFLDTRP